MVAVTKKFSVNVPDAIYAQLEQWADEQGRSPANLAAFLIEVGVRQAVDRGELKPAKPKQRDKQ